LVIMAGKLESQSKNYDESNVNRALAIHGEARLKADPAHPSTLVALGVIAPVLHSLFLQTKQAAKSPVDLTPLMGSAKRIGGSRLGGTVGHGDRLTPGDFPITRWATICAPIMLGSASACAASSSHR
jgi:hypothetical protein